MLIHSCYGRRFKEAKKIKKYKKIRIQIWTDKRIARDSRLFDYKLYFPFLKNDGHNKIKETDYLPHIFNLKIYKTWQKIVTQKD